jgi:hypothetical protein
LGKQSDPRPVLEEIEPQTDRMNTDKDENHSEPDETRGVNAIGLSLDPPDLRASCSYVVRFLPGLAALAAGTEFFSLWTSSPM